MAASSWSGTAAPYTITLSVPGATATNNIEIVPPGDLTTTQAEAYMGASILNGTQEEGSITLKAYGDKPTIDIPIEIIVRGD